MRTDPGIGTRLGPSVHLGAGAIVQLFEKISLSGEERNHLFLADHGRAFDDLSGLSGLDHPGDSRAFGLLDFDRDGWLDIALVNANAPLLQLFRNRIAQSSAEQTSPGGTLAFRFVGGNHTADPQSGLSNRDGYGASVTLDLGDQRMLREHRAGEGFAAQNSATMLIGIGSSRDVQTVSVHWPSGRTHQVKKVPAGTLLTAYEDPTHSPTGEPFTFESYAKPPIDPDRSSARPVRKLQWAARLGDSSRGLKMFTTMATWCPACRRELPRLQRLRSRLAIEELEMFGVPIDTSDSREMLEEYQTEHSPAYRLLLDLSSQEVAEVQEALEEALYHRPLPSTLITDNRGRLLHVVAGVPTISEIRRLLASR